MKKIELDFDILRSNSDVESGEAVEILTDLLYNIEDRFSDLINKPLITLSKFEENNETSIKDDLTIKFQKSIEWINNESSLTDIEKNKVCKWIKKDFHLSFFEFRNVSEGDDNNLKIEKETEIWLNEETNEFEGCSFAALRGKSYVIFNFNKLSEILDSSEKDFQKYNNFKIPMTVFSIINIKETIERLNKINFTEDKILNFFDVKKDEVIIEIKNLGENIEQKSRKKDQFKI